MPSTYTNNLGIQKPGTGEQSGSWGDTVNTNSDILDVGINGVLSLSLSGTSSTLTTSDGVVSNGQYKALTLTGSPSGTHTITISPNDSQKIYYVYNTTSPGQTVIFTQGSGGNVTLLAGDSTIIYANGAGAGAAVVSLADHLAMSSARITGGVITGITDLAVADGGTGGSDAATARTNLGLVIGTNVQAYDAGLQSISGLTTAADRMIYTTALDTYAVTTLTSYARTLLDDADAATARTTLGLGTIATQASSAVSITGGTITGITDLTVSDGGTGVSTLTGIVKGNGTAAFSAAVAGTDYLAPAAIGVTVQAYDADLAALAGLSTTGIVARTGAGTAATRTITAGTGISITNGDGVSGNPTITATGATIPTGVILLWSGAIGAIPSGWVICDGANSTPDLRDRFVVGAGTTYAVGATGGQNTITSVPAHTHGVGSLANASDGAHTHNGTTSNTGAHQHNSDPSSTNQAAASNNVTYTTATSSASGNAGTSVLTSSAGAHSHTFTTDSAGAHTHVISGNTASAGNASVDVRPLYYALCYIMKT
jgi:hypothetical protein